MDSQECYEAIRAYLDIDDSVFREEYKRRKDITVAKLDKTKTPKMCSSIFDLVYDESTRHIRWPTFESYRDEHLADMDAMKKPWCRFSKKKDKNGNVVREFGLDAVHDHMAVIVDDGINVISITFEKE